MRATLLLLTVALGLSSASAQIESAPTVVRIGKKQISLTPPFGFLEGVNSSRFTKLYFENIVSQKQERLGGYLTAQDDKLIKAGKEPQMWHVAFAYTMKDLRDEELSQKDFAELRKEYRENMDAVIQSSAAKTSATIERLGGGPLRETVALQSILYDNATSFAYMDKTSGPKPRLNGTALVLVRRKVICICISKVFSDLKDKEWMNSAVTWWINKIQADNP